MWKGRRGMRWAPARLIPGLHARRIVLATFLGDLGAVACRVDPAYVIFDAIASPIAEMRIGSLANEMPSGATASLIALEMAAGLPR